MVKRKTFFSFIYEPPRDNLDLSLINFIKIKSRRIAFIADVNLTILTLKTYKEEKLIEAVERTKFLPINILSNKSGRIESEDNVYANLKGKVLDSGNNEHREQSSSFEINLSHKNSLMNAKFYLDVPYGTEKESTTLLTNKQFDKEIYKIGTV